MQHLETRRDYLAQVSGGSSAPQVLLVGPLVFDIVSGLLILAAVVAAAELLRRRYPDLLQITILQCLTLTTFAALFLAVFSWRDSAINEMLGYGELSPAQSICGTLAMVCQAYVIAVSVCCALFLARPRWWRNRQA